MRRYVISAIPGDGIGQETTTAARQVLDQVATDWGFELAWRDHPWGCEYYRSTGEMMPADGLSQLADADAILLGSVGAPDVPDHVSLWGLLIPIRRQFEQYVSLRPARLLPGTPAPIQASRGGIDVVVVRENTEGEYSDIGGRMFTGAPEELAVQESVFTRAGITRIARYAFETARRRRGVVASATKSNGIKHTMPFWDQVVEETARDYPDVELTKVHVDALAGLLVLEPKRFDVIVASNLFGDILSDLAAALAGSIGIAPCGNINPPRAHPSMFEPVHGSAFDLVGTGRANPIGQLWSASMMLEHLGEQGAAQQLLAAIEKTVATGRVTPDLGGSLTTAEVVSAVCSARTDVQE